MQLLDNERKRPAVCRYAGVFVIVLPCQHILTVHHLVGAESLPQAGGCVLRTRSVPRANEAVSLLR